MSPAHPHIALLPRPLLRLLAGALAALGFLLPSVLTAGPARAADDYPFRTDGTNAADPWGLTRRQCVSFVAWRLAQQGHPLRRADGWGDAAGWDEVSRRVHVPVTTRAAVGAVAQWHPFERSTLYAGSGADGIFFAGPDGHVATVREVFPDGSVLVEQYNLGGSRSYSRMRVRAPRYLMLGA